MTCNDQKLSKKPYEKLQIAVLNKAAKCNFINKKLVVYCEPAEPIRETCARDSANCG